MISELMTRNAMTGGGGNSVSFAALSLHALITSGTNAMNTSRMRYLMVCPIQASRHFLAQLDVMDAQLPTVSRPYRQVKSDRRVPRRSARAPRTMLIEWRQREHRAGLVPSRSRLRTQVCR